MFTSASKRWKLVECRVRVMFVALTSYSCCDGHADVHPIYVCQVHLILMLFAAVILWPCYVCRADILVHVVCRIDTLVHVMFAALILLFMLCLPRWYPCSCYVCRVDTLLMLCLPRWYPCSCYVCRVDTLVHVMFAALISLFMLCLPRWYPCSCYVCRVDTLLMLCLPRWYPCSCYVCRVDTLLMLCLPRWYPCSCYVCRADILVHVMFTFETKNSFCCLNFNL